MKIFLSLLLSLSFITLSAQSEEAAIKSTINNFFSAMKNADTSLLRSTLNENAIFQTIAINKEGKTEVKNEAIKEFIDFVATAKPNDADERIEFGGIHSDSLLAIVWAPYKFYYKGQFSHCGNNSFQLVKMNEGWKIQYIIDTRRKDGCAAD